MQYKTINVISNVISGTIQENMTRFIQSYGGGLDFSLPSSPSVLGELCSRVTYFFTASSNIHAKKQTIFE